MIHKEKSFILVYITYIIQSSFKVDKTNYKLNQTEKYKKTTHLSRCKILNFFCSTRDKHSYNYYHLSMLLSHSFTTVSINLNNKRRIFSIFFVMYEVYFLVGNVIILFFTGN